MILPSLEFNCDVNPRKGYAYGRKKQKQTNKQTNKTKNKTKAENKKTPLNCFSFFFFFCSPPPFFF